MAREFTMGIRLNYNDNRFTRGMREAQRQTNAFRDSLRSASSASDGFINKLGGIAAALGGIAAARKAFDWLVGANANMEQYQQTLTVVYKSQERALEALEWANQFAKDTPFEIAEIVEATTRMAAYGIEAQKVLGITGDMAAVMGKDLMQAVEAIADAQTGELERLKEFGITKKMIEEQAKLLGSNPINNSGQITDMKAFNAALFALMEERYAGGMAMQAKTFKGMQAKAKDFVSNLGRELGKPVFEKMRANMARLMDTLDQLERSGAIDRFIKKVHRAGAAAWDAFSKASRAIQNAFRAIKKVAEPVIDFIRDNWGTIKPFIEGVAIAVGAVAAAMASMKTFTLAATIAMRLLGAAMLTNPIGWVILGIGLLIGLFIKLNGGIEGAKKVLQGWFDRLKAWYNSDGTQAWVQKAIDLFNMLKERAGQAFSWVVEQAKNYWPQVKEIATTVVDALGMAFQWVKSQVDKYWPTIETVVTTVVKDLVSGFQWLVNAAKEYWPQLKEMVIGVWNNFQQTVLPAAKRFITALINGFKTIWEAVGPLVAAIYNFIKTILPSIIEVGKIIIWVVMNVVWPVVNKILGVIFDVGAAIIPIISKIVSSIIAAFTAVLNWARMIWPAVQKIINWVFQFIKFVWAAIGPFIMAALNVIIGIIKGGFKIIMAIVGFVWSTIKSIIEIAWSIISGIITTALGIFTGDWEMAWEGVKSIFEGIWNGIKDFISGIGQFFYDSGKAIIETLVDGIKSVAEAPVKAFKNIFGKVRDLLPFSDAKKGPLSELTYSGGAIMTTLSAGVNKKAGVFQDAVNGAFSQAALGMTVTAPAFQNAAPAASFIEPQANISPNQVSVAAAPSAASGAPSITIGSLVEKIELYADKDTDADSLVDQLIDKLHQRAKEVVGILSAADKGALI
jgi:phage-related protein